MSEDNLREQINKGQKVTIPITFDLGDFRGGIGHFVLTREDKDPPEPYPQGTLIKWSRSQQECLKSTIQKDKNGVWEMPEVNRALSIVRGLLATTIDEGKVQIPPPKDYRGWVRVLEYWKQLIGRKVK